MIINEDIVLEEEKLIEINEDVKEVLILTYGTLRLNQGNWRYLLEGKSEYLGAYLSEATYTMYGKNAGFPIVVDKGNTEIEYDLFRITNNEVLKRIHNLEGCTGIPRNSKNWYDIKEVDTPHGIGYMYVQHSERNPESIIKTGNWNDRNKGI